MATYATIMCEFCLGYCRLNRALLITYLAFKRHGKQKMVLKNAGRPGCKILPFYPDVLILSGGVREKVLKKDLGCR